MESCIMCYCFCMLLRFDDVGIRLLFLCSESDSARFRPQYWCESGCTTFFFFKQKTAYEMRISDWSSDVCSSDLLPGVDIRAQPYAPYQPWDYSIRSRINA